MWFLDYFYSESNNPVVSCLYSKGATKEYPKLKIYGEAQPPSYTIRNKFDDNGGLLSALSGAALAAGQKLVSEIASVTSIENKENKNEQGFGITEGISKLSQIKIIKSGDLNKKFKDTQIDFSLNFTTYFVQDTEANYEEGFRKKIQGLTTHIACKYNSSKEALKALTGHDINIELFAGFIAPPRDYAPGNALINENNPGTLYLKTPYGTYPNLVITSANVDFPETKCTKGPAYVKFDLTLEPAKTVTIDYLINAQKTLLTSATTAGQYNDYADEDDEEFIRALVAEATRLS